MSSNQPSKTSGKMHEMKGSAVEGVGNVTGSTNWKQSGQQERLQGEGEVKAAQAHGYTQGTGERMAGKKDELMGSATGDRTQQAQGTARREQGSTQQEFNKDF